jgi:Ni/Co efflux regulator RcnB
MTRTGYSRWDDDDSCSYWSNWFEKTKRRHVTYNTRQSVLRRKRIYASFVKSKILKIFDVVRTGYSRWDDDDSCSYCRPTHFVIKEFNIRMLKSPPNQDRYNIILVIYFLIYRNQFDHVITEYSDKWRKLWIIYFILDTKISDESVFKQVYSSTCCTK